MGRRTWTTTAAGFVLLLAGCTSSGNDGPPDVLACDVTYRAAPEADAQNATVEVAREIGQEGNTGSVTFAEGTATELTFEVSYLSSHAGHGMVQIWLTPPGGTERVVQIIEFEGEYPGGPRTTGDEDLGTTDVVVDYACDSA